jgi:hypothetical protein
MYRHWKQFPARIIHCPANQQRFRTAVLGLMAAVAMDSSQHNPFSGFARIHPFSQSRQADLPASDTPSSASKRRRRRPKIWNLSIFLDWWAI